MPRPRKEPKLTIVIPFYNEEENVRWVAEEASEIAERAFPGGWELIGVNDGSKDGTAEALDQLARNHPAVRALHLSPNSGQSAALAAGFRAARGRLIATLDGDGQNDPSAIPEAVALLEKRRVDMVAGIRAKRRDNFVRRASSRIAFRIRNAILRDNAIDTGCGLKVFRRAAMIRVPLFRNSHRYYPALFAMHGYRVAQIPVEHRPRKEGTSKYGSGVFGRAWVGIADLAGVYWLKKRAFRCRVAEHHADQD